MRVWVKNGLDKPENGSPVLIRVYAGSPRALGGEHVFFDAATYDSTDGRWRSDQFVRMDGQVTHWEKIEPPKGEGMIENGPIEWFSSPTTKPPGNTRVLVRYTISGHDNYTAAEYDPAMMEWRCGVVTRPDKQITHWALINFPEGVAG